MPGVGAPGREGLARRYLQPIYKSSRKIRSLAMRRKKWMLALTLAAGLLVGGAAGFIAQARYRPAAKEAKAPAAKSTAPGKAPAKSYVQPKPADSERIRAAIAYLSNNIGVRAQGKAGEKQASSYLLTELEKMGYGVGMEQFQLAGGLISQNLVTADSGTSDKYTIFVCAHMDTRPNSPGANGNASGCSALLEVARTVKDTKHFPEIRFLLFGAGQENSSGAFANGAAYYLGTQPAAERAKIIGVLSLDTIGVGPETCFRDWGSRSPSLATTLVSYAQAKGFNAARLQGSKSDHRPFGESGIPAVWVERMQPGGQPDPKANLSSDTADHVFPNLIAETVNLVRDYLLSLDETACKTMAASATAPPSPGGE